ncbi:glycosyltransferase [Bacillus cereus]|uniref:glycosyltransferase n=1 Tax=Bacillus cereus TaxID=1396 RepID=UPI00123B6673|nr:glycosyltransferase family 2 protein [Bacillus cereus]KAA6470411.1 hypothetical protein DX931_28660 [Bacillus cereus]
MLIVFTCLFFISLLLIVRDSIVLNLHIVRSWKWSQKNNVIDNDLFLRSESVKPNIYVLIPVLQEQAVICKTLDHILKMKYNGLKQIIVITAEKEIKENNGVLKGTTPDIVQKHIDNNKLNKFVKIVHYTSIKGGKSEQLNCGLEYLLTEENIDRKNSYVTLYDADSRPEYPTFTKFSELIYSYYSKYKKLPTAIQQPSLFLRNFNDVSLYPKLEALFSTRWVLGHEIRAQLNSVKYKSNWRAPYAYVVGHGMYIRADFLENTKGFSVPYDDIHMGQRLDFLGKSIHPLTVYDICDVAPSTSEIVKQSGRWFGGGLIWSEFFRTIKLGVKTNPVRNVVLLLKGIVDSFSWMHYLLHFISLIFITLTTLDFNYLIISLVFISLDSILGIILMLKYLPNMGKISNVDIKLNSWSKIILCLLAPVRGIIRGIGPILWFAHLVKSFIKGDYELSKTARTINKN